MFLAETAWLPGARITAIATATIVGTVHKEVVSLMVAGVEAIDTHARRRAHTTCSATIGNMLTVPHSTATGPGSRTRVQTLQVALDGLARLLVVLPGLADEHRVHVVEGGLLGP